MSGERREHGEEQVPIAFWFIPHVTPAGGAPDYIREQWVGVPLPVRESHVLSPKDEVAGFSVGIDIANPLQVVVRQPEESVTIISSDAIKALRIAGRIEAYEYWNDWFASKPFYYGEGLRFHISEGRIITPSEIEREFPDANSFDDID